MEGEKISSTMVDSFISDSMRLAEEFHDFSMELLSGRMRAETIGAIFRAVHSMKGSCGFLVAEDERLSVFSAFCHEFENFLIPLRDGKLQPNKDLCGLIVKGLDAIANDLDLLSVGQGPDGHADLKENFARLSLVSVETQNGFLLFRVLRDIQMGSDADRFIQLLTEGIEGWGKEGAIVIDMQGKFKLSSLSLGAILGFMNEVERVIFLRPPAIMEKLVKRFALEKDGVEIRHTLEDLANI
jgi:hypothetical protein